MSRRTRRVNYQGQDRTRGNRYYHFVEQFPENYIVENPTQSNSRPRFVYTVQRFSDGSPHVIEIRATQRAGETRHEQGTILSTLAETIQQIVIEAVRTQMRVHSRRVREHLTGTLFAVNIHTGQVAGEEHIRMRSRVGNIANLTTEKLSTIMSILQESDQTIDIYDLEWRFVIDPNSLRLGRGVVKPPKYVNKTDFIKTWSNYRDDRGHINCAAFSLNWLMYYVERQYRSQPGRAIRDARELQTKLRWGEWVDLSQISEFVELYPKHRLIILITGLKNIPHVYEGAEWNLDEKTFYLIYDPMQRHYAACKAPGRTLKGMFGEQSRWCEACCTIYSRNANHDCERNPHQKWLSPRYKQECQQCGVFGKHICSVVTCFTCQSYYKRNSFHRCIVMKPERDKIEDTFLAEGMKADGKYTAVWAYDLESRTKRVESVRRVITQFNELRVPFEIEMWGYELVEHVANLVVCRNLFTDEEKIFKGDRCLQDFLVFMLNYNEGNNICIAHNASGYDTRLVFREAVKLTKVSMKPILRGTKFLELTINQKLKFIDSMLHVRGSLKSLAEDFVGDDAIRKGYFPHLFNHEDSYGYKGRIPPKNEFDLKFTMKNEDDVKKFNEWYATWDGREDWDFDHELLEYCRNDVYVLAVIMREYHKIAMNMNGMSPLRNATAPSYIHDVFLTTLTRELELPDRKEQAELYFEKIEDLARNKHWAVLQPFEYWFCRKALRGGRTDVRCLLYEISDENWANGEHITYQDICSEYPYQQVEMDFPVGIPTSYIFDHEYFPCKTHNNNPDLKCKCPDEARIFLDLKEQLQIVDCRYRPQPTTQEILNDQEFFGFICCTLVPPTNLIHPVLVTWNEDYNKSIASLDPEQHKEITVTSIEFRRALELGYRLVRVHRYDKYNRAPSLWREKILDFYIEKMINSREEPSPEEFQYLCEKYERAFGIGDKIWKTKGRWGDYPAKKQTAKIMMNSAWGKHAQRPVMVEAEVYNTNEQDKVCQLFQNISAEKFQLKDVIGFESFFMYRFEKQVTAKPDLHSGYLPAACFVPAWGRLQLFEQMHKLGDRVLMNDTDSIVYINRPGEYAIPQGDMLGEWEIEKIDKKNGGIKTFVGLGPKTYALKCYNGKTAVKAKGLSLNHYTSTIVNFDTMKQLAVDFIHKQKRTIKVPQQTFTYTFKDGMRTWKMLKDLTINEKEMKGELRGNYLYPFCYE